MVSGTNPTAERTAQAALDEWVSRLAPHAVSERWMSLNLMADAKRRFIAGAAEYGNAWEHRDNVAECRAELADALNYTLMAAATGQIGKSGAEVISAKLSEIWSLIGDCGRVL